MFHNAWLLLLLLLIPVVMAIWIRRPMPSLTFSDVSDLKSLPPTIRQRAVWVPSCLSVLTLLVLIVGLARPREGREETIQREEGIAIEMVVDRSGSMQAMDFRLEGRPVDRLTAVKSVAGKFVLGDESTLSGANLAGRRSDLVGLVTFAGYADGIAPPTLDHRYLVGQLNNSSIVIHRNEDGTAIGDAIALAVEKLNALDARQSNKILSKIIILLTDGENNAGEIEPMAAAELASTMGIKIYTIGVGTKGRAPVPVVDMFGRRQMQYMDVNIDEATLTKVAEQTGGEYFRATDTDSLQKIYQRIDQLEKTEVESTRYVDYRELAVQPYPTRFGTLPPLLWIAAGLVLIRLLLQHTWLRTAT